MSSEKVPLVSHCFKAYITKATLPAKAIRTARNTALKFFPSAALPVGAAVVDVVGMEELRPDEMVDVLEETLDDRLDVVTVELLPAAGAEAMLLDVVGAGTAVAPAVLFAEAGEIGELVTGAGFADADVPGLATAGPEADVEATDWVQ